MPTAREITLDKENQELRKKVQGLQNQLDAVLKMLAGKKSEKRPISADDHPSLFDNLETIQVEEPQEEEVSYTRWIFR